MKKSIMTPHLYLRGPSLKDKNALKAFYSRNKDHLAPWETLNDHDYAGSLRNWVKDCKNGNSIRFFIFTKENPDQIIGMCNFTQVFRGAFQACYLGYKIDHQYEGKGFMFEALQHAIRYVFEEEKLHRIMANYMPVNKRSANLLKRLGFEIEGYAKNYLLINGKWEDHVLTALWNRSYE